MNETVGSSLLQLIHRHSRRLCVPATLGIIFVGYFLSISTSGRAWLYWVSLCCLIYLMRPFVMSAIRGAHDTAIRTKLVLTGLYSLLGGAAIGTSILFFPHLDLSERTIVSLILAGFAAGGSATNAGYSPLFLCFVIPLLLPLGIAWMLDPGDYLRPTISLSIGFLIIMMIAVLTVLGRDTFSTFSAYIEVSEKQSQLSKELSVALDRADQERHRAETSDRTKTRFLAAASHDLRQPVHVVSLLGAALQAMEKDERKREIVRDLNVAIESLSEQLDALLDLSKLDSGTVVPELTVLQLQRLVQSVIDEFGEESSEGSTVLVNAIDGPLYVQSDVNMLCRILRNLLGNALKYTQEGTVTISAIDDNDHVTLMCRDTGLGMSTEAQQHAFEEFYQADNPERDRSRGLGLGLSIVERLARCLSHDLQLESELGVGTCVSLRLKKASPRSLARQASYVRTEKPRKGSLFRGWVHVVDDELLARKSMELLLEELGCRTSSTDSTDETIQFLQKNRPDLILVDLRLRGEDSGLLTLNAIERIDPRIRRAIITGEAFVSLSEHGLGDDVTVIKKPARRTEITKLLDRSLSREPCMSASTRPSPV